MGSNMKFIYLYTSASGLGKEEENNLDFDDWKHVREEGFSLVHLHGVTEEQDGILDGEAEVCVSAVGRVAL